MSEREEIYESLRAMYAHYIKYLLLSAIGVVIVAGIYADSGDAFGLKAGSTLALVVAVIAPILCVSWAAGFAYMNVELWALRHYLAYLDSKESENDASTLTLNGDVFKGGLYAAKPDRGLLKKVAYTDHLNFIVALFPATVAICALVMAVLALWSRWGIWGPVVAIAYGAIVAFGYGYVFFVKSRITTKVRAVIYPKPQPQVEDTVVREEAGAGPGN